LDISSINLQRAIDFAVLVSERVNSVLIGLSTTPAFKKENQFRNTENRPLSKSSGTLTTLRNYITRMAQCLLLLLCAYQVFFCFVLFFLLSLALCEFVFISGFDGEVKGAVEDYI